MTTIAPPMPRAGPVEWLLATDHKRTALRTAGLAFVFFPAGDEEDEGQARGAKRGALVVGCQQPLDGARAGHRRRDRGHARRPAGPPEARRSWPRSQCWNSSGCIEITWKSM